MNMNKLILKYFNNNPSKTDEKHYLELLDNLKIIFEKSYFLYKVILFF